MKLPRRNFLHLAAGAASVPAVSRVAWAQVVAAGASDRAIRSRRIVRHHRPSDGSMAVGAAWPAVHDREPAGRRRQYRHRGGRARIAGRLHAAHGRRLERHQVELGGYDQPDADEKPFYRLLSDDKLISHVPSSRAQRLSCCAQPGGRSRPCGLRVALTSANLLLCFALWGEPLRRDNGRLHWRRRVVSRWRGNISAASDRTLPRIEELRLSFRRECDEHGDCDCVFHGSVLSTPLQVQPAIIHL
jgi:hypothetical protein